ncbi:MAG: hypothetical protein IJE03_00280 [Ruminiclostridium sp.]|nr:hypothetical protein [Ruminiclostridium sp.]MBQ9852390.1 hypothetical protein [Ruminiclostridium sp.]
MDEKIKRPIKDERDREIQVQSESWSLGFLTAATQVLTILCLVKGNPAWKGSLALLFIGAGAQLFYKYHKYEEKPYLWMGLVMGLIALALFLWFGFTG